MSGNAAAKEFVVRSYFERPFSVETQREESESTCKKWI